jgi:hypothetical protein
MTQVELLYGHSIPNLEDQPVPVPPPQVPCVHTILGVNGNTPLGTVQVGGCNTSLLANLWFQVIRNSSQG